MFTVLVRVFFNHGKRFVAADSFHGRKIDAGLNEVSDQPLHLVSDGVKKNAFGVS